MKITVKTKKKPTPKAIDWKKLPKGTVVELKNKMRAIVYKECRAGYIGSALLMLEDSVKFDQAFGLLSEPAIRIVGQVVEIIVEEI